MSFDQCWSGIAIPDPRPSIPARVLMRVLIPAPIPAPTVFARTDTRTNTRTNQPQSDTRTIPAPTPEKRYPTNTGIYRILWIIRVGDWGFGTMQSWVIRGFDLPLTKLVFSTGYYLLQLVITTGDWFITASPDWSTRDTPSSLSRAAQQVARWMRSSGSADSAHLRRISAFSMWIASTTRALRCRVGSCRPRLLLYLHI